MLTSIKPLTILFTYLSKYFTHSALSYYSYFCLRYHLNYLKVFYLEKYIKHLTSFLAAKCNEEYKPTGKGDKFYWHYDKTTDACSYHRSNGVFGTNNHFEYRVTCMRTCKTKLYFKYFEKLQITPKRS